MDDILEYILLHFLLYFLFIFLVIINWKLFYLPVRETFYMLTHQNSLIMILNVYRAKLEFLIETNIIRYSRKYWM